MGNRLKLLNHYYLRCNENVALRELKEFLTSKKDEGKLSLRDKVLILKLHSFFDDYSDEKISLEKFLGIGKDINGDCLDISKKLFGPYLGAKGYDGNVEKAINKVRDIKGRGEYDFLGALRRDRIEKRFRKILAHVVLTNKGTSSSKKQNSESCYYSENINEFKGLFKTLEISDISDLQFEKSDKAMLQNDITNSEFSILVKRLERKRKVKVETLDEEYRILQEDISQYISQYISLAGFYYYA